MMLKDDDLKLLEENTGETFAHSKNKLTYLRCVSNSRSSPVASTSRCKSVVKSSEDDLAVGIRCHCDLATNNINGLVRGEVGMKCAFG
jgi:hypothetical protein